MSVSLGRECHGITSAVGNALYDASGRRTRRRGPTRRERTTRRTVSYKASGPDASGMYDASYSVVQGVVQHQHRTTQYDIVRPPSPSRRVNDGSGPSWGKGAFGPLPKYWHFASTTCRQCLQLAGRVYLWCTVSTDPRPPSPCAECCLIEGGGAECCLREGGGGGGGGRVLLKRGGGAECCLRHCTTRRTVSYKASGPDASGMYDASGGVGARRVVKSLFRQ